ncbi:hypothetical protein [Microvirga guangxiensis]|uniref:Uncharacterized protein n=1 Tax=Microvirga guangxiensis TaxID=549386 RepID=A0A1G5JZK3_9HYPH|nr:hypothetical protein [Microvirga guangxiensis]SCY93290.1 hypothetical protein SAMN02927923_02909 [Microvirga guangxiensis]
MLTPELVAEFTRAYQEEVNRLSKEATGKATEIETKLAGVQRKIDGILSAIEDGLYQPSMKTRLAELEAEKAALLSQKNASATIPNVSVHPNLAVYRRKVEELESLLEDAAHRDEAMELVRTLIETIELTPKGRGGGLDAVLYSDLVRILSLCSSGHQAERQQVLRRIVSAFSPGSGYDKALAGVTRRGLLFLVAGT